LASGCFAVVVTDDDLQAGHAEGTLVGRLESDRAAPESKEFRSLNVDVRW
jgi:hypothetical protein